MLDDLGIYIWMSILVVLWIIIMFILSAFDKYKKSMKEKLQDMKNKFFFNGLVQMFKVAFIKNIMAASI
jgi:preprotein translocase subunit SecG